MLSLQNAYEKQQEYIAKTEAYINRFQAGIKAKQARGRQSQLDRLERLDPAHKPDTLNFVFPPLDEYAERVTELMAVTAAYGGKTVFADFSLLVRRGECVALVGPNGIGKTTLLKLLIGELKPQRGTVKLGNRVKIGYFAQEHEGLDPRKSVLGEIMDEFGYGEAQARNYLGMFLFRGDEVYKLVGDLSGGEKARLVLLRLVLSGANFLVLDEPTNHLDIPAKEAVEEALLEYSGTFLVVSHDRYFLDRVAGRVVEMADGRLTEYAGNYSYYREKKRLKKTQAERQPRPPEAKKAGKPRWREQDTVRLVKKAEQDIVMLEAALVATEARLNDPVSQADPATSQALADEYAGLQQELERRYGEWLALTEDSPDESSPDRA